MESLRAASFRTLLRVLLLGLGLVFLLIVMKLHHVQVSGDRDLLVKAEVQTLRPLHRFGTSASELPLRGRILDARGRVLAASFYEHDLVVDPTRFADLQVTRGSKETEEAYVARRRQFRAERLLATLQVLQAAYVAAGLPFEEDFVRNCLQTDRTGEGKRRYHTVLFRGLNPDAHRKLLHVFGEAGRRERAFPSSVLHFEARLVRSYPMGSSCAQVVGIVGQTESDDRNCGRTGLEYFLDEPLTGGTGFIPAQVDGRGREWVGDFDTWLRPGEPADIALTIDASLQAACEQILLRSQAQHEAAGATAVILDVKSGHILAAITVPSADPANLSKDGAKHLNLGAVTQVYEPGSIIKPILVSYARDLGLLSWEETWDCGGSSGQKRFGYRTVREFRANPAPLQTAEVLIRSSNVGSVHIGMERLGIDGMQEAFARFQIFRPLDQILYPSALAGYLDAAQAKRLYDAGPSWPMGYGFTLSPLAMARMYLPFASGGELVQPTLVASVNRGDVSQTPTPARHRALARHVADETLRVLIRVVEEGTGKALKGMPWSVAAKTGTPKDTKTGLYSPVVCAIAPAHAPEIVVTVMHHGVTGAGGKPYTGGAVSGPVAREIIESTLTYLRTPRDR
jgi:cell division protein FtsI (penicillin-binding protein 3)